jgi:hypothetical protein
VQRRLTRTIAAVWIVAVGMVTMSAGAGAKGAQGATITGPHIPGSLVVGNGSQRPAPVNVNDLAAASGTFSAMSSREPSPVKQQRPRGVLGPRYRIVYRMYTGADELSPIRQDVFPFARVGFVSYTPPGQRAFHRAVASGWYTAAVQQELDEGGMTSAAATSLFVSAGVPNPSTRIGR